MAPEGIEGCCVQALASVRASMRPKSILSFGTVPFWCVAAWVIPALDAVRTHATADAAPDGLCRGFGHHDLFVPRSTIHIQEE